MALAYIRLKDLTGKLCKTSPDAFEHGNYADIWPGEFKDEDPPRKVAIKVIRCIFTDEDVKQLNSKLLREARLWSTLKHPNIVPFLGITTDMAPRSAPSLVSPYYKFGNLKSYVRDHVLKLDDKMELLHQFASGIAFLHSRGVVHGDIKPGNVLISDECKAVVMDFGLSRVLDLIGFTTRTTPGTVRYMARELLDPLQSDASGVVRTTQPADVWAFGVAATEWKIFSSKQPYHHCQTEPAVYRFIVNDKGTITLSDYKEEIPWSVQSMLKDCWSADPSKRPSMDDIWRFIGHDMRART